jgi:hypothetical protein
LFFFFSSVQDNSETAILDKISVDFAGFFVFPVLRLIAFREELWMGFQRNELLETRT